MSSFLNKTPQAVLAIAANAVSTISDLAVYNVPQATLAHLDLLDGQLLDAINAQKSA